MNKQKNKKQFFEVLLVSRDDIKLLYRKDEALQKYINNLSDDDMEYLARKFGDAFFEDYYPVLKIVFDNHFLNKD